MIESAAPSDTFGIATLDPDGGARIIMPFSRDRVALLRAIRSLRPSQMPDPLHLARAGALACGLGIDLRCSPAVAAPPGPGSAGWCLRAAREAFLLHWYRVGLVWSRLLRSERMLSRVT